MRWIPVSLLVVHGLIHLMGFAKAFGYAELPQLTQPIARAWGVAWLLAACLVAMTAALLGAGARSYWMVGALALLVSQAVIVAAWRDAWAGTGVNLVLLLIVAHGWLTEGSRSFHAQYVRDASAGLARAAADPVITGADLERLPDPVRRYLRVTRTVGQPRVQNYRLRFRGRIRRAPDSRWMPFDAEQQSFADEPTRLFLMRARLFGVPVEAFHRSVGGHATMPRRGGSPRRSVTIAISALCGSCRSGRHGGCCQTGSSPTANSTSSRSPTTCVDDGRCSQSEHAATLEWRSHDVAPVLRSPCRRRLTATGFQNA